MIKFIISLASLAAGRGLEEGLVALQQVRRDAEEDHFLRQGLRRSRTPLKRGLESKHPGAVTVTMERWCNRLFHGTLTWVICTPRAGKLYKARSRLYRSQMLQVNARWKAHAEIYIMNSFAPFCTVL